MQTYLNNVMKNMKENTVKAYFNYTSLRINNYSFKEKTV